MQYPIHTSIMRMTRMIITQIPAPSPACKDELIRSLLLAEIIYAASWISTSAELNRSLWVPAFYCFVFDAMIKARYLKREHNLRSRLRDLFCFLLRKENNLQILAFFMRK